jgi:hypothetical protein
MTLDGWRRLCGAWFLRWLRCRSDGTRRGRLHLDRRFDWRRLGLDHGL